MLRDIVLNKYNFKNSVIINVSLFNDIVLTKIRQYLANSQISQDSQYSNSQISQESHNSNSKIRQYLANKPLKVYKDFPHKSHFKICSQELSPLLL
jgi:hypothetical protein